MKKILIFISITSLLLSCKKQFNNSDDFNQKNQMVGKVEFNEQINNFISDFMKSLKSTDCIFEIYIDKKTEDEYFLTLFNEPNDSVYLSTHFPVNYTLIDGKYVFIYSGLEDFVKKETYKPDIKIKEAINNDDFEANTISMVISKDTSYLVGSFGLPFSDIRVLPPVYSKTPE